MGRRSYGLSELWVVGVMGRRNRDLTPYNHCLLSLDIVTLPCPAGVQAGTLILCFIVKSFPIIPIEYIGTWPRL